MKTIKTVNLIAINAEKTQICLVKRASEDINKGKWCMPGETMKQAETNNQAVIRIIKDQMNCEVSNFKEFKKTENRVKFAVVLSQYITGTLIGEIKLDKRKYSEAKWFDLTYDLMDLEYAFNEQNIVANLLKNFNK